MSKVATEAQTAQPEGAAPIGHNVLVQVVFYYTGDPLDVDNMLKPILDAMSGIVYVDDDLVTDVRAAKRDLGGSFTLNLRSQTLANALSGGTDFVHVRVEYAPDPRTLL